MSEKCKTYNLLILFISIFVLIFSFIISPSKNLVGSHTQLHLPPCIFYTIFHRKCPFCGLTTSFAFIVRGDLIKAFYAHPFSYIVFLFVMAQIPYRLYLLIKKRECIHISKELNRRIILFILFAFFILWIFRIFGYF